MNKTTILIIMMIMVAVGVEGQSIDNKIKNAKEGDKIEYQQGDYKQIFTKQSDGSWTQTTISKTTLKDYPNSNPPTQQQITSEFAGTQITFTISGKKETYTPQKEQPPIPTEEETARRRFAKEQLRATETRHAKINKE